MEWQLTNRDPTLCFFPLHRFRRPPTAAECPRAWRSLPRRGPASAAPPSGPVRGRTPLESSLPDPAPPATTLCEPAASPSASRPWWKCRPTATTDAKVASKICEKRPR
uniref:(northern house mosquito) hypothetical protein n=1 Tax=Culex pipiens TaxID=7175 RepID=A0A8D8DND9_CULPI